MASAFSQSRWIPLALVVGITAPSLVMSPAPAIQYRDGTVEFSAQPRLVDSYATRNLASDSGATYYLTVDFPAAAEESMDRLVIRMDEGRDSLFRYRLDATEVWQTLGEERRAVSLGAVTQDRETQTLTLAFDPPIPPGGIITVALRPVRNPRFAGVYLFGVTAFPVGETVRPRFMGFARLSFYERDRRPWP